MAKQEKVRIIREIESDVKEIKTKSVNDETDEEKEEDFDSDRFNEFISQGQSNSPNRTPTLQSSNETQEKTDLESDIASTPTSDRKAADNAIDYSATNYEPKYGADYTQVSYSQETTIASQMQMQRARDQDAITRANITSPSELRNIRQSAQSLPENQMRTAQDQSASRNLADYTSKLETEERKRLPFERRRRTV